MTPVECRHPASGLLPWYVNGSLQGTEREWVAGHVALCETCQQECEAIARSSETIVSSRAEPARHSRLPYVLAGVMTIPAVLGIYCLWPKPRMAMRPIQRLSPAVYLDLGAGPTRSAETVQELAPHDDTGAVVISFLVPLSEHAVYSFDLEGPHGAALARNEPLGDIDELGRCTYALPAALLRAAGAYAIVVRVTESDGETRLYPYPFQVAPRSRP